MNPSADPERDRFEAAFSPSVHSPCSREFRAALLARTSRMVRRRRQFRRLGIAAALLGAYLAGLGTMRLSQARQDGRAVARSRPEIVPTPRALAPNAQKISVIKFEISNNPQHSPQMPRPVHVPRSPQSFRVAATKPSRFELFHRQGDRYLQEGNWEAAIRSYSRALDVASERELAISVDRDTWLLMDLKHARRKETRHANRDS